MLGHGKKGCSVGVRFARCAGKNKTDDCNVNITKCANCNGNHHAYDHSCPHRELYLNIRSKFMSKN